MPGTRSDPTYEFRVAAYQPPMSDPRTGKGKAPLLRQGGQPNSTTRRCRVLSWEARLRPEVHHPVGHRQHLGVVARRQHGEARIPKAPEDASGRVQVDPPSSPSSTALACEALLLATRK